MSWKNGRYYAWGTQYHHDDPAAAYGHYNPRSNRLLPSYPARESYPPPRQSHPRPRYQSPPRRGKINFPVKSGSSSCCGKTHFPVKTGTLLSPTGALKKFENRPIFTKKTNSKLVKPLKEPLKKPATTPSDKAIRTPKAKPPDKPIRVAKTKLSDKTTRTPETKPPDKPIMTPEIKVSEKSTIDPETKLSKKPIKSVITKPSDIPIRMPETKLSDKTTRTPETKPPDKPIMTPETKVSEKSTIDPETKLSNKPIKTAITKPSEIPIKMPETKLSDKTTRTPETKPPDKPIMTPEIKVSEKSTRDPETKLSDKPIMTRDTKPSDIPIRMPETKPPDIRVGNKKGTQEESGETLEMKRTDSKNSEHDSEINTKKSETKYLKTPSIQAIEITNPQNKAINNNKVVSTTSNNLITAIKSRNIELSRKGPDIQAIDIKKQAELEQSDQPREEKEKEHSSDSNGIEKTVLSDIPTMSLPSINNEIGTDDKTGKSEVIILSDDNDDEKNEPCTSLKVNPSKEIIENKQTSQDSKESQNVMKDKNKKVQIEELPSEVEVLFEKIETTSRVLTSTSETQIEPVDEIKHTDTSAPSTMEELNSIESSNKGLLKARNIYELLKKNDNVNQAATISESSNSNTNKSIQPNVAVIKPVNIVNPNFSSRVGKPIPTLQKNPNIQNKTSNCPSPSSESNFNRQHLLPLNQQHTQRLNPLCAPTPFPQNQYNDPLPHHFLQPHFQNQSSGPGPFSMQNGGFSAPPMQQPTSSNYQWQYNTPLPFYHQEYNYYPQNEHFPNQHFQHAHYPVENYPANVSCNVHSQREPQINVSNTTIAPQQQHSSENNVLVCIDEPVNQKLTGKPVNQMLTDNSSLSGTHTAESNNDTTQNLDAQPSLSVQSTTSNEVTCESSPSITQSAIGPTKDTSEEVSASTSVKSNPKEPDIILTPQSKTANENPGSFTLNDKSVKTNLEKSNKRNSNDPNCTKFKSTDSALNIDILKNKTTFELSKQVMKTMHALQCQLKGFGLEQHFTGLFQNISANFFGQMKSEFSKLERLKENRQDDENRALIRLNNSVLTFSNEVKSIKEKTKDKTFAFCRDEDILFPLASEVCIDQKEKQCRSEDKCSNDETSTIIKSLDDQILEFLSSGLQKFQHRNTQVYNRIHKSMSANMAEESSYKDSPLSQISSTNSSYSSDEKETRSRLGARELSPVLGNANKTTSQTRKDSESNIRPRNRFNRKRSRSMSPRRYKARRSISPQQSRPINDRNLECDARSRKYRPSFEKERDKISGHFARRILSISPSKCRKNEIRSRRGEKWSPSRSPSSKSRTRNVEQGPRRYLKRSSRSRGEKRSLSISPPTKHMKECPRENARKSSVSPGKMFQTSQPSRHIVQRSLSISSSSSSFRSVSRSPTRSGIRYKQRVKCKAKCSKSKSPERKEKTCVRNKTSLARSRSDVHESVSRNTLSSSTRNNEQCYGRHDIRAVSRGTSGSPVRNKKITHLNVSRSSESPAIPQILKNQRKSSDCVEKSSSKIMSKSPIKNKDTLSRQKVEKYLCPAYDIEKITQDSPASFDTSLRSELYKDLVVSNSQETRTKVQIKSCVTFSSTSTHSVIKRNQRSVSPTIHPTENTRKRKRSPIVFSPSPKRSEYLEYPESYIEDISEEDDDDWNNAFDTNINSRCSFDLRSKIRKRHVSPEIMYDKEDLYHKTKEILRKRKRKPKLIRNNDRQGLTKVKSKYSKNHEDLEKYFKIRNKMQNLGNETSKIITKGLDRENGGVSVEVLKKNVEDVLKYMENDFNFLSTEDNSNKNASTDFEKKQLSLKRNFQKSSENNPPTDSTCNLDDIEEGEIFDDIDLREILNNVKRKKGITDPLLEDSEKHQLLLEAKKYLEYKLQLISCESDQEEDESSENPMLDNLSPRENGKNNALDGLNTDQKIDKKSEEIKNDGVVNNKVEGKERNIEDLEQETRLINDKQIIGYNAQSNILVLPTIGNNPSENSDSLIETEGSAKKSPQSKIISNDNDEDDFNFIGDLLADIDDILENVECDEPKSPCKNEFVADSLDTNLPQENINNEPQKPIQLKSKFSKRNDAHQKIKQKSQHNSYDSKSTLVMNSSECGKSTAEEIGVCETDLHEKRKTAKGMGNMSSSTKKKKSNIEELLSKQSNINELVTKEYANTHKDDVLDSLVENENNMMKQFVVSRKQNIDEMKTTGTSVTTETNRTLDMSIKTIQQTGTHANDKVFQATSQDSSTEKRNKWYSLSNYSKAKLHSESIEEDTKKYKFFETKNIDIAPSIPSPVQKEMITLYDPKFNSDYEGGVCNVTMMSKAVVEKCMRVTPEHQPSEETAVKKNKMKDQIDKADLVKGKSSGFKNSNSKKDNIASKKGDEKICARKSQSEKMRQSHRTLLELKPSEKRNKKECKTLTGSKISVTSKEEDSESMSNEKDSKSAEMRKYFLKNKEQRDSNYNSEDTEHEKDSKSEKRQRYPLRNKVQRDFTSDSEDNKIKDDKKYGEKRKCSLRNEEPRNSKSTSEEKDEDNGKCERRKKYPQRSDNSPDYQQGDEKSVQSSKYPQRCNKQRDCKSNSKEKEDGEKSRYLLRNNNHGHCETISEDKTDKKCERERKCPLRNSEQRDPESDTEEENEIDTKSGRENTPRSYRQPDSEESDTSTPKTRYPRRSNVKNISFVELESDLDTPTDWSESDENSNNTTDKKSAAGRVKGTKSESPKENKTSQVKCSKNAHESELNKDRSLSNRILESKAYHKKEIKKCDSSQKKISKIRKSEIPEKKCDLLAKKKKCDIPRKNCDEIANKRKCDEAEIKKKRDSTELNKDDRKVLGKGNIWNVETLGSTNNCDTNKLTVNTTGENGSKPA